LVSKDNKEMKKMAIAAAFVALFTANAQADTVGLYLGGQVWQSETIFKPFKFTPLSFTIAV